MAQEIAQTAKLSGRLLTRNARSRQGYPLRWCAIFVSGFRWRDLIFVV